MAFLGMKGTGQFAVDERPKSWREGILREYPNGVAPLTAILSMMDSEPVDDYQFYWWTDTFPDENADVTGVYTDATLSTAFTTAARAKDLFLYVKMSEENSTKFRPGLSVHLVKKDDSTKYAYGKVTQVVPNGADSYLAVKLIEAIGASQAAGVNYVRIIGTVNAQGAARPESQLRKPEKFDNLTQIFRDPLSMTRTALQTRLRTVESRKEARRQALEYHAIRMERAFINSVKSETIGTNGQPETTTQGIIPFIRTNAPDNIDSYKRNASYSGTWIAGGADWFNEKLEQIFRFGNTEKLALVGSGALEGINRLAQYLGTVNLQTRQVDYGLQVVEWVTAHGVLYMMSSPLFTQDEFNRNSMLILEPKKLKFRYIQDTVFKSDVDYDNMNASDLGKDAAEEEFLTEAGLEMHFPNHMAFLEDVGKDN